MAEIVLANLTDIPTFLGNMVTMTGTSGTAVNPGVYLVNQSGAFAYTLPLGNSLTVGNFFFIKDFSGTAGANNITITGQAGVQIDNSANYVISTNFGSVLIVWNGAKFNVLAKF